MAKKKKLACAKGAAAMPRNTVSLVLDGTVEQYLLNFERCMTYFRYWILCKAAVRIRIGNRLIYTTPVEETFYFCMRYRGRYIVFPIVARMAWLVGFYTANGVFQMEFKDQSGPYMDSELCEMTGFSAGHGTLAATSTHDTRLGLHYMRDSFDSIADYRGPRHPEPTGFRAAIGAVIVHIMESKFREIFIRNCRGITDPTFSRLGLGWQDFVHILITNWSSLSEEGMMGVDNPNHVINNQGIEKFRTLWDILDDIFFLHVDAYDGGIFLHEPLPPAPRQLAWRPIDPGEGDGDIPLPDQRAGARVQGRKRSCLTVRGTKEGNKRRRRELTGGGAGGPPVIPEWFIKWEQRDDELQCNAVQHHLSELGLHVWQQNCSSAPAPNAVDALVPAPDAAAALAPAPDEQTSISEAPDVVPGPPNLGECELRLGDLALSGVDLKSLERQNFISDGVISFVFAQMSASFDQQEDDLNLMLVQPGLSLLLGNLEDPDYLAYHSAALRLGSRCARLLLFPVSDNKNFDQADGGSHWSLLVLHIQADGSSRFVHHDSLKQANLPHARRLADTLRPLLSGNPLLIEGPTPLQQPGSNDCGLYVLAVSQAICTWWMDWGRNGRSDSWFPAVLADVSLARVQAMRAELLHLKNETGGVGPSLSK